MHNVVAGATRAARVIMYLKGGIKHYVSNRKINIELHCLFVCLYASIGVQTEIYVEASATPRCCARHYGFKGRNKTYYVANRLTIV